MKVVLVVIGTLALLFVVLLGLTAPTAKKLSRCMDAYSTSTEIELAQAKLEGWDKQQLCTSGKQTIGELIRCYDEVESKSFVPTSMIFSILEVISPSAGEVSREKVLLFHNSACFEYPKTLIAN